MLKKRLFLAVLVLAVIASSCKKSKNDSVTDPFNVPYNGATVEQNKATLEDNGVQFIGKIDQLQKVDAIKVMVHFGELSGNDAFIQNTVASKALAPLKLLSSVTERKGFNRLLKSLESSGPADLKDAWDSVVGKYTYDTLTQKFEKTTLSNEVIIEFPGSDTDRTNTAVITIDNFTYVTLTDPIFNSSLDPEELPTTINLSLTYAGKEISSWDYSATFQSDGMPLTFSSTFTIEDFSINGTLAHTPYTYGSVTFSFKYLTQIILETHLEGNGDWSQDNIDANTKDNVDTIISWVWNDTTSQYDEVKEIDHYNTYTFENILLNANAYMQVMNIKVAGKIDLNKLVPSIKKIIDDSTLTEHKFMVQITDTLNAYAKLVVITTDNGKVAVAEAYPYVNDYGDWAISMRFVFQDGSHVDARTYFGEGFDGIKEALNTLIGDINDEHDLNLDYLTK